jgi:hypothetical protein
MVFSLARTQQMNLRVRHPSSFLPRVGSYNQTSRLSFLSFVLLVIPTGAPRLLRRAVAAS